MWGNAPICAYTPYPWVPVYGGLGSTSLIPGCPDRPGHGRTSTAQTAEFLHNASSSNGSAQFGSPSTLRMDQLDGSGVRSVPVRCRVGRSKPLGWMDGCPR